MGLSVRARTRRDHIAARAARPKPPKVVDWTSGAAQFVLPPPGWKADIVVTPDFARRYGGRPTHNREMQRIVWTPEAIRMWTNDRLVPTYEPNNGPTMAQATRAASLYFEEDTRG